MYHLAYFHTPFENGTKLQVMNVDYKFPPSSGKQSDINTLIMQLLVANPDERMTVGTLLSELCRLGNFQESPEVGLSKQAGM